ncbi:class I SAM-dependent methyltransferase [Bacillus sp. FJAT-29937]|uniref:class I SAM-dependent methyltransferase n=1 Tax=Bacillus sp. FJAT-29937 TaxID=1720553 RepID=UPI0008375278|nr:class I SAM-dependent methyltransferase [Bacillus sp. FJAT-29937]
MDNYTPSSKPTKEIWDSVADEYSLDISNSDISLSREIIEIFNSVGITNENELLEAGSGSGHLSGLLSKNGFDVSLLDFSPNALKKSEVFFNRYGFKGKFILDDLLELKKVNEKKSVVWNSGVLEHFDDIELVNCLLSIRNIAKDYFIFLVPNANSLPYLLYRHKLMSQDEWKFGTEYLREDYDYFLYGTGFEVVEKFYVGWEITNYMLEKVLGFQDNMNLIHYFKSLGLLTSENSYLVGYVTKPKKGFHYSDDFFKGYQGVTKQRTYDFDTFSYNSDGVDSILAVDRFNELERKINEKDQLLLKMQQVIDEASNWIKKSENEIKLRDKYILEKNKEIKDISKWALSLEETIKKRDSQILHYNTELEEKTLLLNDSIKELEEIKGSKFWPMIRRILPEKK